jgi:phosphomannomutase
VQDELKKFDGRILVRKSGTESLLRILVESNDSKKTSEYSENLTNFAIQINE